jgi:DNA-binding NarL/FixJ family response regulator
VRILICEDSVLLREGIARLLTDAGHDVVAQLPDATAIEAAVRDTDPDLAILDVRMPPTRTNEGILAAIGIRSRGDRPRVLVLSQYVEERYAADLIASSPAGFGYLLKDRARMERLTPRERQVLALMAEGGANQTIADRLYISAGSVEKHISAVFQKLELEPEDGNRRVLAVLAHLDAPLTDQNDVPGGIR